MAGTRILIHGAGLVGVYLGGRLALGGADVTLLGRKAVLDRIRARGLTISHHSRPAMHLGEGARLRLTEDAASLADADLVLLTVKSAATAAAAEELRRHLRPRVPVVSFQNGVTNAPLLKGLLPMRLVLAGMVPFNVAETAPGTYHQGTEGALVVENYSGVSDIVGHAAMRDLAAACHRAGMPLRFSTDMQAVLWGKLVVNLNNAINALSGMPLVWQLGSRDYRRCTALAQAEALRVLRTARIKVVDATPLPTRLLPFLLTLPDGLYRRVAGRGVKIDSKARSSMADDLAAGRRTEVDWINGEVVRLAEALKRSAPVNSRLVDLIRAAEAGAPPLPADDLLAQLKAAR